MSVYTPHFAPIAVLAFLGTGALLVLCVSVALIGALRRSRPAVVGALAAGVTILSGYAAVLLGLSLYSKDVEMSEGAWKYFCEIDCHIAYDVTSSEPAGDRGRAITLRTWFDPSTIAPFRGNGPLSPGPRT